MDENDRCETMLVLCSGIAEYGWEMLAASIDEPTTLRGKDRRLWGFGGCTRSRSYINSALSDVNIVIASLISTSSRPGLPSLSVWMAKNVAD